MADALATKIREARVQADLSREGLASSLGVSLVTVVRWETGRTKRISTDTLLGVARATRKPLSFFLKEAA